LSAAIIIIVIINITTVCCAEQFISTQRQRWQFCVHCWAWRLNSFHVDCVNTHVSQRWCLWCLC